MAKKVKNQKVTPVANPAVATSELQNPAAASSSTTSTTVAQSTTKSIELTIAADPINADSVQLPEKISIQPKDTPRGVTAKSVGEKSRTASLELNPTMPQAPAPVDPEKKKSTFFVSGENQPTAENSLFQVLKNSSAFYAGSNDQSQTQNITSNDPTVKSNVTSIATVQSNMTVSQNKSGFRRAASDEASFFSQSSAEGLGENSSQIKESRKTSKSSRSQKMSTIMGELAADRSTKIQKGDNKVDNKDQKDQTNAARTADFTIASSLKAYTTTSSISSLKEMREIPKMSGKNSSDASAISNASSKTATSEDSAPFTEVVSKKTKKAEKERKSRKREEKAVTESQKEEKKDSAKESTKSSTWSCCWYCSWTR